MVKDGKKTIALLRHKILSWYRVNKRDLPWRKTSDPYAILVSEVMLQQTQVLRVLPKYAEFIEAYPTVDALANASLGDVLRIWSGLGYNRRAKYLWQMAEMVMNGYNGQIPNTYKELRKLPGVGDYTANAVLCFAFKKKAPAVDTNVRNVIERELERDPNILIHPNDPNNSDHSDANSDQLVLSASKDSDRTKQITGKVSMSLIHIKHILMNLMPDNHPDEFLHALMDYSAMRLTRPERKKGRAIPFKQSNRYLRGRILARITHHPYHSKTLISVVQKETNRSDEDITHALDGLLKEHLITRSQGLLQLPPVVAESLR